MGYSTKVKEIYDTESGNFRYVFGKKVGDFHIGDIMLFKRRDTDKPELGFVAETNNGQPFIMGWGSDDFNKFKYIKKITGWEEVDNDLLNVVHKDFQIREVPIVEMTVQEIERELGYRIKIVK